ncbi:ABC transporter permease subunit [Paraburkholderia sp. MPAMCS5]|uniref:ABC transporter permease subunit n=1 Tax=Paraburkholderia sp. MPAMCS5 TaxID=3112563 RepID=UPI002E1877D1|nr:ABC transporter permease subunit [Paraburkholderia sp. MPAMCS5]
MIRLTNLGIRLVDRDILEAADAFGSSGWQRLLKVQLPLALPTIMAGVNQTIMMALAMVVVAAMIGVQGLGQPVLKAIANQYFTHETEISSGARRGGRDTLPWHAGSRSRLRERHDCKHELAER